MRVSRFIGRQCSRWNRANPSCSCGFGLLYPSPPGVWVQHMSAPPPTCMEAWFAGEFFKGFSADYRYFRVGEWVDPSCWVTPAEGDPGVGTQPAPTTIQWSPGTAVVTFSGANTHPPIPRARPPPAIYPNGQWPNFRWVLLTATCLENFCGEKGARGGQLAHNKDQVGLGRRKSTGPADPGGAKWWERGILKAVGGTAWRLAGVSETGLWSRRKSRVASQGERPDSDPYPTGQLPPAWPAIAGACVALVAS